MKVLVVDDDWDLVDILTYSLRREGYTAIAAFDGQQGLARFEAENPDLVVLDINMPRINGFEVCRKIRSESPTPIIILTARDREEDVVKGFNLGADDYLTKPFSPKQLLLRIRAVLRRCISRAEPVSTEIEVGDLILNPQRREVFKNGKRIRLTNIEFRILHCLALHRGQVVTPEAIVERVWSYDEGGPHLIKTHIHHLRKKIEDDPSNPRYIKTVPGVGYSLAM